MKRILLIASLTALCGQLPAQSVTINLSTPGQYISVMGGDMERTAAKLDTATNAQQIADWLYKDISYFWYCRVSYDKAQEVTEGSPNMAFYNGAISAMKKIKISRPTVKFWATLKSDYDGYGTTSNLPAWIYTGGGYNGGTYDPTLVNTAKYARFLADYLKQMNANGVPIAYMSVSKEWQQVMDYIREKQTIDSLKSLLATSAYSGVPVPVFVGPAAWGTVQGGTFIGQVDAAGYENRYQGFAVHDYDTPTETEWSTTIDKATAAGKKIWNDESAAGGGGKEYGAEPPISTPLSAYAKKCVWYRQGLAGELFFENWNGDANYSRAIHFGSGTAGVRMRSYYLMKQFANTAAGTYYIPSTRSGLTGVDTMVFQRGNQVTIWLINSSTTANYGTVTVNITGGTLTTGTVSKTVWNGTTTPITGSTTTYGRTSTTSFGASSGLSTLGCYTFTVN